MSQYYCQEYDDKYFDGNLPTFRVDVKRTQFVGKKHL
jgi:hypothetical protein